MHACRSKYLGLCMYIHKNMWYCLKDSRSWVRQLWPLNFLALFLYKMTLLLLREQNCWYTLQGFNSLGTWHWSGVALTFHIRYFQAGRRGAGGFDQEWHSNTADDVVQLVESLRCGARIQHTMWSRLIEDEMVDLKFGKRCGSDYRKRGPHPSN